MPANGETTGEKQRTDDVEEGFASLFACREQCSVIVVREAKLVV